MEKVICFGIGQIYKGYRELIHSKYEVVGLMDNDKNKQGQVIDLLEVKSPESLLGSRDITYDKVIITPTGLKLEMFNQLISLGIPYEKIDLCFFYGMSVYIPQKHIVNNQLVLECNGIKLYIKNHLDAILVFEVFIEKSYELGLDDSSNYVAIDIGANISDTALYFATIDNIKKIYAYEPFKSTFNKGLENLKLNPNFSKKIEYNNFGIGASDKELFLDDYDENQRLNSKEGKDKITVKNVAGIFNDIFAKHNEEIFLKMDCEGSEWEILEKLDSENMLNKISVIAMEWHIDTGEGIESQKIKFLKELLKKNGFMFKFSFSGVDTDHDIIVGMIYAFNFRRKLK